MKTLYLHIGTHKTASSTLQLFFRENKSRLAEKGFYYPTEGSYLHSAGNSQSLLAHALRGVVPNYLGNDVRFTREDCIADIRRDIQRAPCENILVSSEHFSHSATPEDVQAISETFAPVVSDVKIIVYLRRQDSRLESGYNQNVKMGDVTSSFEEFIEKALSTPNSPYLYDHRLKLFADVYGKGSLIVRPFEKCQLHPNGIVSDFLSLLGIDSVAGFRVTEDKNRSLPNELIDIMRLYGSQLPSVEHRRAFNRFVASVRLDIDARRFTFFTHELRERVLKFYEESNRAVAREYLHRGSGELFLESAESDLPVYEGLAAETLLRVSARLWLAEEHQKAILVRKLGRANSQPRPGSTA